MLDIVVVVVGEVAKLDEGRRDKRGEGEPELLCADRSEAVDDCFFSTGVEDLRRSSRKDVELDMRRGVDRRSLEADRGVASAGDSRDGDGREGDTGGGGPLGE